MPQLTHGAAVRRDRQLLRIRKLSLWIAGGAAAVSLGLGTAFAHALPGHSQAAAPPAGRQTGNPAGGAATSRAAGQSDRAGGSGHRQAHRLASHRRAQHRLAPPAHKPAPAPKPTQPPVVSGGS